jgi:hypothetical protein
MPESPLSGIRAIRHLLMIFQHHITRITPSAAFYGRAGCITFHCQQFGNAGCIPFYHTISMDVQGVSLSTTPLVWTCRMYPFPQQAIGTCRVYSFPVPVAAGCTPFHHQQCKHAGLYHSPSIAVWTCRVYI